MEAQRKGIFRNHISISFHRLPFYYNLYKIRKACYNEIIYLQIIDYTSVRGGVSVLTNKAEITSSYLIIQKAQIEDGGIYSCENGVVDPAKVKVHVLTGKCDVSSSWKNGILG